MAIKFRQVDPAAAAAKIEQPTGGITNTGESVVSGESEVDVAVKTMAMLIYNTYHSYWMSASDFEGTVNDRFNVMEAAFGKTEEVRFTIRHQSLMINGVLADMGNRYIKFITEHLSKMEISNFTLTRGMTAGEFKGLLGLLGKSPAHVAQLGGFAAAVGSMGFKNVEARKIVLKEINEDELVVAKEHVDTAAIERKKQSESVTLAFLNDDNAALTEESVECLREASREPKKIAEAMAKVADSKTGAAQDANTDDRKKVVVGLLERFFDGLMKHPSARSRTGKKAVEKTLEELKTELLEAIHAGPEDDISKAVGEAVDRMVEGLKIAGVAVDYSKKLKALEDSERRILRFIKAQGLQKLKQAEMEEQLGEAGLDVSGWERLLAKSGAAEVPHVGDESGSSVGMEESAAAIENLAAILVRLEGQISKPKDDTDAASVEKLTGELKDVSEKVDVMTEGTARKIKDLVGAVTADIDKVESLEKVAGDAGGGPKLPRRRMVEMLAEIVQEICQPLAVIRCSVEMVQSAKLGQVTAGQQSMLNLAAQGIDRIGVLAKSLEGISGMPTTLSPDREITDTFYAKK